MPLHRMVTRFPVTAACHEATTKAQLAAVQLVLPELNRAYKAKPSPSQTSRPLGGSLDLGGMISE